MKVVDDCSFTVRRAKEDAWNVRPLPRSVTIRRVTSSGRPALPPSVAAAALASSASLSCSEL